MRIFPRVASILLLAVFAVAAPVDDPMVRAWADRISKTAILLEAKDYSSALRLANRSVSEMVDHLGPGDGSAKWFGVVLTHKALALAGLGDHEEALWYWYTVLGIYPKLAETDLSSFGEAGAFLKAHLTPPEPAKLIGDPTKAVVPPKLVKRVHPEFPQGAADFFASGALVVEVVIGTDGRVKSPRIIHPLDAPTLSYAALEAVKRWKFEPARVENVPVEVLFNLTVNYKPR